VAVNCLVTAVGMPGFAGVTAMDRSTAAVTVNVVLPDSAPNVAVINDVPAATPVARPLASTVVTDGVPDVHVTVAVISCDVPSEYVPVAVNCLVTAMGIFGFAGDTKIEISVAELETDPVPESPPPLQLVMSATTSKINGILFDIIDAYSWRD